MEMSPLQCSRMAWRIPGFSSRVHCRHCQDSFPAVRIQIDRAKLEIARAPILGSELTCPALSGLNPISPAPTPGRRRAVPNAPRRGGSRGPTVGARGGGQMSVCLPTRGRHVRSPSRSRSTREIAIRSRHRSEIWRGDLPSDCALTVADSDAIVAGEQGWGGR